jgi:hypothetical protein
LLARQTLYNPSFLFSGMGSAMLEQHRYIGGVSCCM